MSPYDIKLEVCVDSIASAISARAGGAARIELCSALSEGGLTPSCGTLKTLKDLPLGIPIYCMLRPRRGNDFVYSQLEMEAICRDIELLRAHGADGFVFGALTPKGTIDEERCMRVVQLSAGCPCTFHRAFDLTAPEAMHTTVERLKELGFKRILSSGFRQNAAEGVDFLAQLIAKHNREIIIMPGAGINIENLARILTTTMCTELHASCKGSDANVKVNTPAACIRKDYDIAMGKQDMDPYSITNESVVRKIVAITGRQTKNLNF